MNFFLKTIGVWVINALSVLLAAYLLPGIEVPGFYIALILALVLGLLNALVRPVLVIITLPFVVITLGLFMLIINGFLFWIPSTFIDGFYVENFGWAILGGALLSVFSWIGGKLFD